MTVSEARAALPEVIGRVLAGDEVTLTRHGVPVAVVVRPDTLRARRAVRVAATAERVAATAERVHRVLERGREAHLRARQRVGPDRAAELVADVRAARAPIGRPIEVDAFDADVHIYAAVPEHPLGRRVRALFEAGGAEAADRSRVGSVLLIPELISKPLWDGATEELEDLGAMLARVELRPADVTTAELAAAFGATYSLSAADAIHLATGVQAGADRFVTNSRSDFPRSITEIDITYPSDLADPRDHAAL